MQPHVLLILILLGDPSGGDVAKKLGDELARRGGEQVQVVVGADAVKALEERGIKPSDLLASPNIGEHLTASDRNLVVIHLDRRIAAGDVVVDTKLWLDGRSDQHVAIAGNGQDPSAAVESGVMDIIGARLPGGAPKAADPGDETYLAALAGREQWTEVLGLLAAQKDKTPRQCYYQVLAFSRLRQREPAVEALNAMRAAYPGHFLIAAAAEVLPPAAAPAPADDADLGAKPTQDDGSNTLRDADIPGKASTDEGGLLIRPVEPKPEEKPVEKPAEKTEVQSAPR